MENASNRRPASVQPRARPGGRAQRVVRDVLQAAAVELARVGYAAFRIEEVAARAGVNKTTIYRRWPTKADLVGAVLLAFASDEHEAPDTGSLRSDLLEMLRGLVARISTPEGEGLSRAFLAEMDQPEICGLIQAVREKFKAPWFSAIARGIARGEIPRGSDPDLIVESILAITRHQRQYRRERPSDALTAAIIDLILDGAKGGGAIPKP
jgi:AcrR family transcriptional regulator